MAEATRLQQVHLVAEWLSAGEDVDAQDRQGNTALHWSCLLGLHSLTSLLLAHDARTDIPNQNGSFAVHAAVNGKNIRAMKMLSGDKSKHTSKQVFLLRDRKGYTPFILAAECNDVYTMEWLYLQGVGLDQRGYRGETALQLVSQLGHTRALQWLISHKASVFECDNDGRTAFHHACIEGCHEAIKMLTDAGAQSIQSVDDHGDGALSLAWKHGQRCLASWLICANALQAFGDALSFRSAMRSILSRSAWTTVFWSLLLLNFATFVLMTPPKMQALQWFALLGCGVLLWFHLALSDPGFVGPRMAVRETARQDPEAQKLGQLNQKPLDEQVAELKLQWEASGADGTRLSGAAFEAPLSGSLAEPSTSRSSRSFRRLEENEEHADQEVGPEEEVAITQTAHFERHGLKLARAQQLCWVLREKLEAARARKGGAASPEGRELRALRELSEKMRRAALKLIEEAGPCRFREMSARSGEYAHLAMEGDFRTLCVICRRVRSLRSFHCKLCGCCVQRMDHHCPWVDRCIGLQNQRSFYVFLLVLAAVFILFIQLSLTFLEQASFSTAAVVVMIVILCDVPAMMFVFALILRQSVYMLVNVTTYEILVCPPHVCQRFPRRSSSLWYLQDCSLQGCLRNIVSYWTMDMSRDFLDFEDSSDVNTKDRPPSCCGFRAGYQYQRDEDLDCQDPNEGITQKLNSRTVVLPSRSLSL